MKSLLLLSLLQVKNFKGFDDHDAIDNAYEQLCDYVKEKEIRKIKSKDYYKYRYFVITEQDKLKRIQDTIEYIQEDIDDYVLCELVKYNNMNLIKLCIDYGADHYSKAMAIATEEGNYKLVKYFYGKEKYYHYTIGDCYDKAVKQKNIPLIIFFGLKMEWKETKSWSKWFVFWWIVGYLGHIIIDEVIRNECCVYLEHEHKFIEYFRNNLND